MIKLGMKLFSNMSIVVYMFSSSGWGTKIPGKDTNVVLSEIEIFLYLNLQPSQVGVERARSKEIMK